MNLNYVLFVKESNVFHVIPPDMIKCLGIYVINVMGMEKSKKNKKL